VTYNCEFYFIFICVEFFYIDLRQLHLASLRFTYCKFYLIIIVIYYIFNVVGPERP